LDRSVRKRQSEELKKIVKTRENVIICGDFNIFRGRKELESLARDCGLTIVNSPLEATFPAVRPKKTLDLFLCPPNLHATARVINGVRASDHLPVLLEMEF
jgi:endonuclease/exonuclease/phosphatase family metal-dependent hydrolase